jgi:hypothetical protein
LAPPLPRRDLSLKTINAAWLSTVLSLAFALAVPTQVAADASTDAAYREAVSQTLALVQSAQPNDTAAAHQALNVLEAGTGLTQPEVVADLQLLPPDFEDAINRLQALLAALTAPVDTSDPAQAQQQLKGVLAMPRYDALHRPQSWFDRLRQWVSDRINDLLSVFFRQAGSSPFPDYFWYALGTIVVAGFAFLIFRSTRGRFTEDALATGPSGPRAPADYFAEADLYAAAGDRVRAIRALCAGVAATLAGERTWEGSPLTVREIFQRAPDPTSLRPLLVPFEAAVYGGREVDAATYERATHVAEPFRRPSELAA